MDPGVLAAIRHFPDRRRTIEELAIRSESFRSLCSDLAEAESALRTWEAASSPRQAERCEEYRMLIASLEDELRATIDAAAGADGATGGRSR